MEDADAERVEVDAVARLDLGDADARGLRVEVELGRADDMDRLFRLSQRHDPQLGVLGADEVMGRKLRVAVAEDLVDRARDLATLDMGGADVIGGADQRTGQRLDPVAMNHGEVGAMLGQEIGEADDRLCQDHVLRVPLALVLELEHLGPGEPRDLELGPAVAVHQVHPGHEEADREARVAGGRRERLQLAEIGARAGDEEDALVHLTWV